MTDKSEPALQTLVCARPGPQVGGWGYDREDLKAAADGIHYFWDESLDALVWRGREDERLGRLHYTKAYRYLGEPIPSIGTYTPSVAVDPTAVLRDPVSINQREGVASARSSEWIDPLLTPAPRGVTIQILTASGRQISGQWMPDTPFFIAWAPLMKTPEWAKERISASYRDTVHISGCQPVEHVTYRPLTEEEFRHENPAD